MAKGTPMANKLTVCLIGNNILREKSAPVEKIDDSVRETLNDMLRTMYAENGAGLAAPQIGLLKRMIVLRTADGVDMKIINPELSEFSENTVAMEEGCLSVLGTDGPVFADVVRPESVRVKWLDENGAPHDAIWTGINARIIQHEFDHLEGILFVDRVSSLKRTKLTNKVRKGDKQRAQEKVAA
jgi:peptide deformylase